MSDTKLLNDMSNGELFAYTETWSATNARESILVVIINELVIRLKEQTQGGDPYDTKCGNALPVVNDEMVHAAFNVLFYAPADYPREIGRYENGFAAMRRALEAALAKSK